MKAFLVFSSLSAICCRSCSSRLFFSCSSVLRRLSSGCTCASCSCRLFTSASRSCTVCTHKHHHMCFECTADNLISSLHHFYEVIKHFTSNIEGGPEKKPSLNSFPTVSKSPTKHSFHSIKLTSHLTVSLVNEQITLHYALTSWIKHFY